jgi:glycosyltransferase involved in cell wall biosynthesis
VLHVVPSFALGGHRRRIEILAVGLGPAFSHHVVAMDGGVGAALLQAQISLIPFAGTSSRSVHVRTLRSLSRLLARERPEVLVTYNWGAIEAALANRLGVRAPHLHCEDGFSGAAAIHGEPFRRAVFRHLVLNRSMLAVPSQTLVQTARSRWRMPQERIALIRNGVDVAHFAGAAAARAPDRTGGAVVGMLSRLSPEKNVGFLIRAFARLAESTSARLAIAGDGVERAMLEGLATQLGVADRTRFLGHVADPAAFLSGVDLFALSSVTEQLPFSLLEAMASGLPVVATDVGDVREALAPPNRDLLAPTEDEAALAAALGRLLRSAELRRSLGAANAQRARELFDQQNMIEAYRSLLQGLAAPTRLTR